MHVHAYTVQSERRLCTDRQIRGRCPLPAWDEICQLALTVRKEEPPLPSQTWLHCLQDRRSHEHTGQENRICPWSREMPALSLVQEGPQPVCPWGPQPCCRPPSARPPGMFYRTFSSDFFKYPFWLRYGSRNSSELSCALAMRVTHVSVAAGRPEGLESQPQLSEVPLSLQFKTRDGNFLSVHTES